MKVSRKNSTPRTDERNRTCTDIKLNIKTKRDNRPMKEKCNILLMKQVHKVGLSQTIETEHFRT